MIHQVSDRAIAGAWPNHESFFFIYVIKKTIFNSLDFLLGHGEALYSIELTV